MTCFPGFVSKYKNMPTMLWAKTEGMADETDILLILRNNKENIQHVLYWFLKCFFALNSKVKQNFFIQRSSLLYQISFRNHPLRP